MGSKRKKKAAGANGDAARSKADPARPSAAVPPRSPDVSGGRWTAVGVCVFLAVAVWIVFGQTLGFEFINYDDPLSLEDTAVTGGLTLKGIASAFGRSHAYNWVPLTTISQMLDHELFGQDAGRHHLVNVVLHAATAIFLFLVLRLMTGAPWRSAVVAAVFAVHPLRVESVAWVAERKDVLGGLFFVLTIWAYVRRVRKPGSRAFGALTILFFALGLMSKPMVVTLPCVLLLLDWWPLSRFAVAEKDGASPLRGLVVEKIPLFAMSVAAAAITVLVQGEVIRRADAIAMPARVANAITSYATYVGQMFYPANLAILYPFPIDGVPAWQVAAALLLLAAVSAAAVRWRRTHPALLVGWLWYLGTLVPVIGLVQVGVQAHADRYTYLPHIGLYVAVAWLAADLSTRLPHRFAALAGFSGAVIAALTFGARAQAARWEDSETIWAHTLASTSDNYVAESNLGNVLFRKGRGTEAIARYRNAVAIKPDYAKAHFNLGVALAESGQAGEAVAHYEKAIAIAPEYAEAVMNLGNALLQAGRIDDAIVRYRRALDISPGHAKVLYNLGNALFRKGKVIDAISQWEKSLEIDPTQAEVWYNMGIALEQIGQADQAIERYRRAVELKPDYADAHHNWGVALAIKGQVDDAIAHFQRALEIRPDFALARANLDRALRQKKQRR